MSTLLGPPFVGGFAGAAFGLDDPAVALAVADLVVIRGVFFVTPPPMTFGVFEFGEVLLFDLVFGFGFSTGGAGSRVRRVAVRDVVGWGWG